MGGFLARRLAAAVVVLWGVSVLTFLLMRAAPGGPAQLLLDARVTAEARQQMIRQLGLDRPLSEQYLTWLARAVRGDLGRSLTGEPVTAVVAARLPATLLLMGTAFGLALALGVPAGVWTAARRGGAADLVVTALSFAAVAVPVFWLALVLQLIFGVRLGWLPTGGSMTPGDGSAADRLRHLVLPAGILGLAWGAGYARYVRACVADVLDRPFVRAALARGLPRRVVLIRHALRNALLPLITLVGLDLPALLGGALVVETVFAWPGIGRLFFEKAFERDYNVLMGLVLLGGAATVAGSLLADLAYALADPRVRVHRER
ncbi:MAG: ABC transporter permease [Clostridia bacterium]|nr:ABC transporter permease [Clostridia bacterium]